MTDLFCSFADGKRLARRGLAVRVKLEKEGFEVCKQLGRWKFEGGCSPAPSIDCIFSSCRHHPNRAVAGPEGESKGGLDRWMDFGR